MQIQFTVDVMIRLQDVNTYLGLSVNICDKNVT